MKEIARVPRRSRLRHSHFVGQCGHATVLVPRRRRRRGVGVGTRCTTPGHDATTTIDVPLDGVG